MGNPFPKLKTWFECAEERDAEIARLRDALKPFAALAREFCVDERDPHEVVTHATIHAGDLLTAFNALEK